MNVQHSALLTRTFAFSLLAIAGMRSSAIAPERPAGSGVPVSRPRAEACVPASSITEIAYNNVRTIIENGGNMWTRRGGTSRPGYEIPKTTDFTGPCSIYAGGLWMGGISSDNQLKLAAVLFRANGNDFWPGPLSADNSPDPATTTPQICDAYDRFWITQRAQAEAHIQFVGCSTDPDCVLEEIFPDGYSVPEAFQSWPAEGQIDAGQDLYLAPFYDADGDGTYDPSAGDYPDYGFEQTVEDCKTRRREDPVNLFGDFNIFWIINDKGDAHTESGGSDPIGLEVRCQAFAFSSNNEINNMTFYNYTVINQGTQTLTQTYFGHFIDPDLGCSNDDFVGCDVQRGFGFAYNWDENDESGCSGVPGYGAQPPAVGVDFFEGPYQDADGVDNPGPQNNVDVFDCVQAQLQNGIPYKGIGIGYGDDVPDNERFGMRAFLYWNREGANATNDPSAQGHFYNYLRGRWKDNTPMTHGGSGYAPGNIAAVSTRYMFPWTSDPVGWGTNCAPQGDWREEVQQSPDRRFVQSAGPFVLEPGAFNNITLGVAYARASAGGAIASVASLRTADDKAQALFDNCFKILDGPDAPDLEIIELDRELVIYMTNPEGSNNNPLRPLDLPPLSYEELDPIIPEFRTTETISYEIEQVYYYDNSNVVIDSLDKILPLDSGFVNYDTTTTTVFYDQKYHFQGYKLFQVKDESVSVTDLDNVELARLVYQGDIRDGVKQIVNYPYNEVIGLPVPVEMVNGADQGVASSVKVIEDKFATGDTRLVNFKSYYYIAIAYGHNNYEPYDPIERSGQAFSYVAGRKAAVGAIRRYVGIPHPVAPAFGGTILNASYGDELPITRLEGQGNGGLSLALTVGSENAIMSGAPWRKEEITYERGRGPVRVKVIDPLKLPEGEFEIRFQDSTTIGDLVDAYWQIVNLSTLDTIDAERAIDLSYEQVIPEWGISVQIDPVAVGVSPTFYQAPASEGSIVFADPSRAWLTGVPDGEGESVLNWIRAGTYVATDDTPEQIYNDRLESDDDFLDPDQTYESILGGTWAPWNFAGQAPFQPGTTLETTTADSIRPHQSMEGGNNGLLIESAKLRENPSVQIVITSDKSKWSRSPVFEMESNPGLAQGGAKRMGIRISASIDKDGRKSGTPGCNESEATFINASGMGWFPGYAIDLETGERLNIGYGESSFWGGEIGKDMIWNPNGQFFTNTGSPFFGGGHWIYVFKNDRRISGNNTYVPMYDDGRFIREQLAGDTPSRRRILRGISWVGSAMLVPGQQLLATDVRIILNVQQPYKKYVDYVGMEGAPIDVSRNAGLPLYRFKTTGLAVENNVLATAQDALEMINVVPNPYYGFSGYETSRLDNRVKFTNLPQTCTISIYNVSGTLVRKFRKDNELTYLDWDLKNTTNIPISGGVYICHVDVPGVGEKVIKWFGVLRPLDLQNF